MSSEDSLRIGAIFITMAASAIGYGIPFLRGAPKNHDDALSASWMSIKCFSSGVIFSVALVHLLGEALEVLRVHQALLFHGEENHEEEHRRRMEEAVHGEDGEEEHGHGFPAGMTLCVIGAILTLGVELMTNVMMSMQATPNSHSASSSSSGVTAPESSKLIGTSHNASAHGTSSNDIESGDTGNGPDGMGSRSSTLCNDPYRLEPGHTHKAGENIHCHVEHGHCDIDLPPSDAGNTRTYGTSASVAAGSCDHPTEQECSSSCSAHENTSHLHSHSSHAMCKDDSDGMHRHVSIVVEDRNKSIVKSMVLETCISIHSIIIGVSIGSMHDTAELGTFLGALSFHQLFEGISLGAASMQASYNKFANILFMLVFILSMPVGIVIGLSIPVTDYGMAIQACFSCVAAGSLIYTSLVEMVAEDFSHVMHSVSTSGKREFTVDEAKKIGAMFTSFCAGCFGMAAIGQWA